jgi:hypothetical protein
VGALGLDEEKFHAALDRLRSEQFLRRLQSHPLAPEVATPNGKPFRRSGGGAAAQAAPAGRARKRVQAQGSEARRRGRGVDPNRSRNRQDGRRLIGRWWWGQSAA